VDLASPVTDLDLSPTGAFVLAVLRAENAYVRLPLPGAFDAGAVLDRHVLTGELVGSAALAADGNTAVLYTTAVEPPVERLVVVDLRPGATTAPLPVPLKKGVRAVAVAPDGKTAIVLHTKVAGDPADPKIDVEAQLDRSYGYTIVNLQSGFPKLQLTSAEVSSLALTPDGARAFVMVRGPAWCSGSRSAASSSTTSRWAARRWRWRCWATRSSGCSSARSTRRGASASSTGRPASWNR
jgi:hypothetical protein